METITLHSTVPESLGEFHLSNKEYCQYLYYPIKLAGSFILEMEPRLQFLNHLVTSALLNENKGKDFDWLKKQYVYLTVKQTLVPKGIDQNRPGFHSDGFGTNDVQYIWFDKFPTEFMIGNYTVPVDDVESMREFEKFGNWISAMRKSDGTWHQKEKNGFFHQPSPFHLYRIDQNHIHRTVPAPETDVRLFVKLTISEHRYAQEGNSHNYGLNYDWEMTHRKTDRNQPHQK
ncbi:hypothetical protein [Dyadobacter sp. CY312]|uniref:hypothetical protein n=1 Tax=Dyadobacter sp. CY312 TaxID=2907303 RepID=UPI001F437AFF|nr:hypothetical protein [Dyadobacter sp. CY312]MCE7039270.1 hypothetical protein [Dyadobacter sp. CY312]